VELCRILQQKNVKIVTQNTETLTAKLLFPDLQKEQHNQIYSPMLRFCLIGATELLSMGTGKSVSRCFLIVIITASRHSSSY